MAGVPLRRRVLLTAATVFACTLLACAPAESPAPPTSAAPDPHAMDRFTTQQLTWDECAPYATRNEVKEAFQATGLDCTRLTVPLDYAKPGGAVITIGVLRHRTDKPGQRIGSLVVNPGGPGGSGMESAAQLGPLLAGTPLGDRFDVVGFDPRGVAASGPPVRCLTDQERDAERADDAKPDGSPQDFGTKCAQRTKHGDAMLANLGTRDVAKDLDLLRGALDEEKLSFLGYSYGTRIGYTYAEAFPARVRAMVLDAAVDPVRDALDWDVEQAEGFGKAFGEFATACTQRPDCALGQDPAGAIKAYQDLVRSLITGQIKADDGRRLSFKDATIATVHSLYAQQFWPRLNFALQELKNGRGNELVKLADEYDERGPDGHYSSSQDLFTAVTCVDSPKITDKERILQARRQRDAAAPFLDDGRPEGAALTSCEYWPVPNTSVGHLPKVDGMAPVLVISTTGDPVTPYQAGVDVAKSLKGGLLTFEGIQHTAFLHGNRCVDEAGAAYLVDTKLPAEGTRCTS